MTASPNNQLAPEPGRGPQEPVLSEVPAPPAHSDHHQFYPRQWKEDPSFRPHEIASVTRVAHGEGEAKLKEFSDKFRAELKTGQENGVTYDYIILYRKEQENEAG